MSGKGSKPRPKSVSDEVFSNNFDSIFRKDSEKEEFSVQIENRIYTHGRYVSEDQATWTESGGYESCKETDTDRTDAAKNRALVNR